MAVTTPNDGLWASTAGGENSCQDGLWGAWSVWFGDPRAGGLRFTTLVGCFNQQKQDERKQSWIWIGCTYRVNTVCIDMAIYYIHVQLCVV